MVMQTIELIDGGILLYAERFLSVELADRCFIAIRDECVWEQMPGIFGHMQPRLTASYGDDGLSYRYSGTVNVARPWTPTLLNIKEKIEAEAPPPRRGGRGQRRERRIERIERCARDGRHAGSLSAAPASGHRAGATTRPA